MKKALFITMFLLGSLGSKATIHVINVWDGYFQFLPNTLTVQLGDTIQWLPFDQPTMVHTVTSTNIPSGAATFDYTWQAPADTFFQYIPQFVGVYDYECTPHAVSHNMIGSFEVVDSTQNSIEKHSIEISIRPNPTQDQLYIDELNSKAEYFIYSVDGSLVKKGVTSGIVDVSDIKSGTFVIELVGDVRRTKQFVKE